MTILLMQKIEIFLECYLQQQGESGAIEDWIRKLFAIPICAIQRVVTVDASEYLADDLQCKESGEVLHDHRLIHLLLDQIDQTICLLCKHRHKGPEEGHRESLEIKRCIIIITIIVCIYFSFCIAANLRVVEGWYVKGATILTGA